MRIVLKVITWVTIVAGTAVTAANNHRVCSPTNSDFSYTGYRLEIELNKYLTPIFHLFMCKEGRVLLDISEPLNTNSDLNGTGIPWGQEVCNAGGTDCFKLARRPSFVSRSIPVFFPGTLVGGIFDGDSNAILPLIANNVWSDQWVEVVGLFSFKYHFPILHTPPIYDKKHPLNHQSAAVWCKHINAEENYTVSQQESQYFGRKAVDLTAKSASRILKLEKSSVSRVWATGGSKKSPIVRVLLILKVVSTEVFTGLLMDLEKLYNKLF